MSRPRLHAREAPRVRLGIRANLPAQDAHHRWDARSTPTSSGRQRDRACRAARSYPTFAHPVAVPKEFLCANSGLEDEVAAAGFWGIRRTITSSMSRSFLGTALFFLR